MKKAKHVRTNLYICLPTGCRCVAKALNVYQLQEKNKPKEKISFYSSYGHLYTKWHLIENYCLEKFAKVLIDTYFCYKYYRNGEIQFWCKKGKSNGTANGQPQICTGFFYQSLYQNNTLSNRIANKRFGTFYSRVQNK